MPANFVKTVEIDGQDAIWLDIERVTRIKMFNVASGMVRLTAGTSCYRNAIDISRAQANEVHVNLLNWGFDDTKLASGRTYTKPGEWAEKVYAR